MGLIRHRTASARPTSIHGTPVLTCVETPIRRHAAVRLCPIGRDCRRPFTPNTPGSPSAPEYVRRLLTTRTEHHHLGRPAALVEPLSDRELDVLRLLDTDLGGPEIARALSVSLSTVRTHTRNIFPSSA